MVIAATMECSAVLVLLLVFVSSTQARSLASSDLRQSDAFKAFEARFLQQLGMKRVPRVRRDAVVPQYMLDLYNSRVRDEEFISTNLVFKDFATTANTVRAFHHTDIPNEVSDAVKRTKRRVFLDVASSVPSHEELVKAEFRVFNNYTSTDPPIGNHTINVYQIISAGTRKLLDSKTVNVSSAGWHSYNILEAVKHWHKLPGENHGLELDILSDNGLPMDTSHLHLEKPLEMGEQEWPHHRPLFALFSRDPNTHYHKRRERRGAGHHKRNQGLCKRVDLQVDFEKHLKWNWVIGPKNYNAYMCQGKCVYPLANHMNTTNHAIVQTLVHSVRKYRGKIPPACCVPTELESIMLLYYSDNNGKRSAAVEIKDFPNMRVIGCGCR